MKKETQKKFSTAVVMLVAFVLWTVAVRSIDVQPIGPRGSTVGFAALNGAFHQLTGVHMDLYVLTDLLSLVPLMTVVGFAVLGLVQWIRRKSLLKVDHSILILGIFYLVVMGSFLLFEMVVINHRPVLIDRALEASYPSSTTMLVMCVMPTARMQLAARIKRRTFRRFVTVAIDIFTVFMVVARLISGVHWSSDVIGGALLSAGLVMMYQASITMAGP